MWGQFTARLLPATAKQYCGVSHMHASSVHTAHGSFHFILRIPACTKKPRHTASRGTSRNFCFHRCEGSRKSQWAPCSPPVATKDIDKAQLSVSGMAWRWADWVCSRGYLRVPIPSHCMRAEDRFAFCSSIRAWGQVGALLITGGFSVAGAHPKCSIKETVSGLGRQPHC